MTKTIKLQESRTYRERPIHGVATLSRRMYTPEQKSALGVNHYYRTLNVGQEILYLKFEYISLPSSPPGVEGVVTRVSGCLRKSTWELFSG